MGKKLCSVDSCPRESWARGLCNTHYRRFRARGSPTGGGAPRGNYAGSRQRYYRDVVLSYEGEECLIWPFRRHAENGYALWSSGNGTCLVSRMVCEDVFGPAPFLAAEAAHSCGKGHMGCIAKTHLRWASKSENESDKLSHGTDNRGERHPLAKLVESEIAEILSLQGVISAAKIGERYGVSGGSIQSIFAGKNWDWLATTRKDRVDRLHAKGTGHGMAKLTEDNVRDIRKLALTRTQTDVAQIFGVAKSTIRSILIGRTWKHLD